MEGNAKEHEEKTEEEERETHVSIEKGGQLHPWTTWVFCSQRVNRKKNLNSWSQTILPKGFYLSVLKGVFYAK